MASLPEHRILTFTGLTSYDSHILKGLNPGDAYSSRLKRRKWALGTPLPVSQALDGPALHMAETWSAIVRPDYALRWLDPERFEVKANHFARFVVRL